MSDTKKRSTNRRHRENDDVDNPPSIEGRVPPHDLDAEASVLSAVMLDPEAMPKVLDLKAEHFYSEAHRRIFEACVELREANKPIDVVQVGTWLKDRQRLAQVGGMPYLGQILDSCPVVANVAAHARTVREKYRVRQLILACQRIAAQGYGDYGPIDTFLADAEKAVLEACSDERRRRSGLRKLSQIVETTMKTLDEQSKLTTKTIGISTGFRDLDRQIGGFFDGDLTILAARPGMGKTSLVFNLSENVAKRGAATAVFELEMPEEQVAQRHLASNGGVNMLALRRAELTATDWQRVTRSASVLHPLHIYVDDTPGIGLLEIAIKLRRLKADLARPKDGAKEGVKLGLVIIDYLQLMKLRNEDDVTRSLAEISKGLKSLAKELGCPIVALSQLNRGVESRENKRPHMADLRDSGALEQDADNIFFVYRDEYYRPETPEPGIAELIVAKQRNGPTGTVKLGFLKESTTFLNLEHGDYAA